MNGTTCNEQPLWGMSNPLDFYAVPQPMPTRVSLGKRAVNSHGRRFLDALADIIIRRSFLMESRV